jgi:hypothetical protein
MSAKEAEKLPSVEKQSIGEKDLDYAKEFWTVGNVIAGFSIVQTLWFFTVVASGHEGVSQGVRDNRAFAGLATIGGTVLYLLGIGFAHSAHYKIIEGYILSKSFRKSLFWFWIFRYIIVAATGIAISYTCFNFRLATGCLPL